MKVNWEDVQEDYKKKDERIAELEADNDRLHARDLLIRSISTISYDQGFDDYVATGFVCGRCGHENNYDPEVDASLIKDEEDETVCEKCKENTILIN